MFLRATAKINLCLDVLRKRPDGYHDVRMVMQMVGMYDRLHLYAVKRSDPDGRPGRITLSVNLPYIPADENNLAVRAARLLMDEKGVTDDLEIKLGKFIPVAAGLAGGSSDAAMTMIGVNRLFHLGFSDEELMERGKKIGADVPYCIMRGTALSEGIGEILTPLPDLPECGILLSKPSCPVSTKEVYGSLRANELGADDHPDVDLMLEALKRGDLHGICDAKCMSNVLEGVTAPNHPLIGQLEKEMVSLGALNAVMSGSGPTVFGIFENIDAATRACREIRIRYPQVRSFATRPVKREES